MSIIALALLFLLWVVASSVWLAVVVFGLINLLRVIIKKQPILITNDEDGMIELPISSMLDGVASCALCVIMLFILMPPGITDNIVLSFVILLVVSLLPFCIILEIGEKSFFFSIKNSKKLCLYPQKGD